MNLPYSIVAERVLRCYKITEKTGYVIGVKTIKPEEEIMLITTEGIVIRMKSDSISVIGQKYFWC